MRILIFKVHSVHEQGGKEPCRLCSEPCWRLQTFLGHVLGWGRCLVLEAAQINYQQI